MNLIIGIELSQDHHSEEGRENGNLSHNVMNIEEKVLKFEVLKSLNEGLQPLIGTDGLSLLFLGIERDSQTL